MSITILTPYKLFFITQSDELFALMKDGRLLKIKKTPYFPALSADGKTLCGISFDGENTHILSMPFGFDLAKTKEIASLFGYFYYPCLAKGDRKMAVIEADLLKPRPEGELRIYTRKITKWYQKQSFSAKMKAPVFCMRDDSLFFIDNQNNLVRLQEQTLDSLSQIATDVSCFALSKRQTRIAYFSDSQIHVYSLVDKKELAAISMLNVTALGFDANEQEVFYATAQENRYAIYAYSISSSRVALLYQTSEPVSFLFGG